MAYTNVLAILFIIEILSLRSTLVDSRSHALPPSIRPHSVDISDIPRPLNIAHRGASGRLPEHTLEAYRQAVQDGADYIECDVTLSMDRVPICMHENTLSRTTDVANRPEFAERRRTLTIPLVGTFDDWFAIDFTLDELKTLRKKQAYDFRDQTFNGRYIIPTLEEFLVFSNENNSRMGIYPELKDPQWLNSLSIMNGTRFEDIVLEILNKYGYTDESSPCFIQSFNEASLEYLSPNTTIKLAMLIDQDATDEELDKWKSVGIDGIGVSTTAISKYHNVLNGYKNWINGTTDLVDRAHARGLKVHVWTMRNEDKYLAWDFNQDVHKFIDHFLNLRVDGIFTDFPETLSKYLHLLYSPSDVTPPSDVTSPSEMNAGVKYDSGVKMLAIELVIVLSSCILI